MTVIGAMRVLRGTTRHPRPLSRVTLMVEKIDGIFSDATKIATSGVSQ